MNKIMKMDFLAISGGLDIRMENIQGLGIVSTFGEATTNMVF